ncbi:MAG: hypothetical protein U1F11_05160 [Steroidobacteraceae bacterium]
MFNALVSLQEDANAVQERRATTGVNEVIAGPAAPTSARNTGRFQPAALAAAREADIALADTAAASLADRASRAIAAALAQPPAREPAAGPEAEPEQEPEAEPRDSVPIR